MKERPTMQPNLETINVRQDEESLRISFSFWLRTYLHIINSLNTYSQFKKTTTLKLIIGSNLSLDDSLQNI